MNFNKHSELAGKHAFLSGSNYHWLNYTTDRLREVWRNVSAKIMGTKLHEFAKDAINLHRPLMENGDTVSMYVNDCIYHGLSPEVTLYYSRNAFGTADGISFDNDKLKIYDLKTGKHPASMKQLMIYAAFFCLEYEINPNDIPIELRIYQSGEIVVYEPEPEEIWDIIDILIAFDNIVSEMSPSNGDDL